MKPFKKINPVNKEVKKSVKFKIKESKSINQYRNMIKKSDVTVIKKYHKSMLNLRAVEARLLTLFEKGLYRNLDKAKKTYKKFIDYNNLFIEKLNDVIANGELHYKSVYLKNRKMESEVNLVMFDSFVKRYTKIVEEMTKKLQKIMFIEDLNPILNEAIEKYKTLFTEDFYKN